MGTATFSDVQKVSVGGQNMAALATLTLSSSYATGGDTLDVSGLPFQYIDSFLISPLTESSEYIAQLATSNTKIKMSTLAGSLSGGTAAAQTFTGTAPTSSLNLATPAFSGTGFATAGQVITTTQNQTMAATTTAAGMWFINTAQAATLPTLILSNTIVSGAPAVLTCQGTPPATDAGAWKIVKNVTPAGTNGSSAVSGTSGTMSLTEVTAVTDLSAVTLRVLVFGRN